MFFRTDLAVETRELIGENIDGIIYSKKKLDNISITDIKIETLEASKKLQKPIGNYITIEFENLTDNFKHDNITIENIAKEIQKLIPKSGLALIVGIGNTKITPDALGPKVSSYILSTRHISKNLAKSIGIKNLRPVSSISPGVLGQTGIETNEFIKSIVKTINPSVVIVIDALASKQLKHLGCTIQISDTGICPGSGVGNSRPCINEENLGTKVISVGIPTVVDAITLIYDIIGEKNLPKNIEKFISSKGKLMMVTPREIDLLIERSSKLIGLSLNCALQSNFSVDDILMLV